MTAANPAAAPTPVRPPGRLPRKPTPAKAAPAKAEDAFDWTQWYLEEEDDMGQSPLQALICSLIVDVFKRWAKEKGWADAFAEGDVFFAWVPEHVKVRVSPDAFVVDTLPATLPKSWQTWVPGNLPPRVAVEVVSDDWHKDYRDNPLKYYQLGCGELIIYDPEYDQHPRTKGRVALQVYRRVEGRFSLAYSGAGPAYSVELGAWLVQTGAGLGRRLRLARDAAGKDLVLTGDEGEAVAVQRAQAEAQRAQAEAERADRERQARGVAEAQANAERMARLAADAEVARLLAELERLRGR